MGYGSYSDVHSTRCMQLWISSSEHVFLFQVMKAKIAIVAMVAGRAKVFGRKTVAAILPTIVDKLGDAKVWWVTYDDL